MREDTSNPFVGLRPFEMDESLLFFGRNEQRLELLQRLHQHHFVAVVGSSGCGKSSLLRAGLIPALKAGYLVEDSDQWYIAIMKPGHSPLYNLAEAILHQVNPETDPVSVAALVKQIHEEGADALLNLIAPVWKERKINFFLLVDQFEELFRFAMESGDVARKDEAIDFVNIILEFSQQVQVPFFVVLTMRSDFIGDCSQFNGLPEAMNKSLYLVPKLNRQQLKMVIENPVKLFGGKINPALTSRLLNELGKVKDELPLLQHALMRMWDFEMDVDKNGELDLQDYKNIGGIEKALSKHADEALEGMTADDLLLTKHIFQALTAIDENGRKIRRPVLISQLKELTGATEEKLFDIINRFIEDQRSFLFVNQVGNTGDKVIDISHESLIRQWATLSEWVDEEGESVSNYLQLAEAARLHQENKKDFLSGAELQFALDWYNEFKPSVAWANRYKEGFEECITYLKYSEADRLRLVSLDKARNRKQRFMKISLAIIIPLVLASAIYLYKLDDSKQKLMDYTLKTLNFSEELPRIVKEFEQEKQSAVDAVIDLNNYIPEDLNELSDKDSLIKYKIMLRLKRYLDKVKIDTVKSQDYPQMIEDTENSDSSNIYILDRSYKWTLLKELMPNATEKSIKQFIYGFNNSSFSVAINLPERFVVFIAVVAYESNELRNLETSYDYSTNELLQSKKLRNLFPDSAKARKYSHNPEMLANLIHANSNGNGNEASGDGSRYHGRGILKMKGKSRYAYYSKYSKYDLIQNPDTLTFITVATDIACIAWVVKLGGAEFVNKFADEKNFERIEQIILDVELPSKESPPLSMKEYYEKAYNLLQI